ncbi:response regulator transcription factor [Leifsonia sp. 2TAF2]|uniref:response regulator transcription factor n=1 Tax=Leifsonia sp. 2TAF2 TaxID=3233009 RepID=UPI003F9967BF
MARVRGACRCCGSPTLTARQVEVLLLLGRGDALAEIANELFVSPHTVAHHITAMQVTFGVRNRVALAVIAIAAGIVSADAWPPAWSGLLCTALPERQCAKRIAGNGD